jgi:predicted nucleic acid-binding protein
MKRCILDSSFLIDLLNEIVGGVAGPAIRWLQRNPAAQLWVTPVTVTEVLEGAHDPEAVKSYLARYSWQGIHRVHAERVAIRQKRASQRLGENDAWQTAIAEHLDAVVVGHDHAFHRLGEAYEDHWRAGRAK